MTMETITPFMAERVDSLVRCWKDLGKGKLAPSKALKKLEYAVAKGCPLMECCAECEKLRECPLLNFEEETEV